MRLPPLTPGQFRRALAEQHDLRRGNARGWIGFGSLVFLMMAGSAVAHYAFGMPIHDRDSGELLSPGMTVLMFLGIGGTAALFAVLGVLLLKWNPRP